MNTENQVVKDFLKRVIDKKIEDKLGVELDIGFWTKIIQSHQNEDEMRDELAREREKLVHDKAGKTISDGRDLEKIAKLERGIAFVAEAKEQINKLKEMRERLDLYFNHLSNPGEETLKVLESVAQ